MRDEKDKTEKRDDFSDYMRRRLDGHRLPVEDGCWEELEARMKQKSLSGVWWWGGSLLVAAILALVVWLLPIPEDMPLVDPAFSKGRMAERAGEVSLPRGSATVSVPGGRGLFVRKVVVQATVKEPVWLEDIPEIMIEDNPEVEIVAIPLAESVKRTGATVPEPDGYRAYRMEKSERKEAKRKNSRQNKWQLSAAVASSRFVERPLGLSSDEVMDNIPPADSNDPSNDPNGDDEGKNEENGRPIHGGSQTNLRSSSLRSFTDEMPEFDHSFESYPEVRYSLPLSLGFTIRKELSKHIGVESGLIYTYLSTTFRQTGKSRTEVRSKLYYLGIPVNLVVNLWDHPKWNIYLSGGVMMEKGIQAVYNERKIGMNRVDSRTVKENIGGLQWSMNTSVGVAYHIYRDWSLYLEPRFSYYFASGQPVSIRTDKPLGFGLNGGIRFAF